MFWKVNILYKRGPFHVPKSQRFEKKGVNFFCQIVSGKGSLSILENDHTSPILQLSGGTGIGVDLLVVHKIIVVLSLTTQSHTNSVLPTF